MCTNLVLGVILWYFEMVSGVFIWLRQNKLYDPSIVNVGIYPMPFYEKKKGESFDNEMRNLQLG